MERDGPPLAATEAAKVLGVSYPTFRKAIDAGAVPGVFRLGNLLRVPRPVVWALLNGIPLDQVLDGRMCASAPPTLSAAGT